MKKFIFYCLISVLLLTITSYLLPISYAQNLDVPPAGPKQIEAVVSRVISVSVGLIFVVLVFVLIWGGIKYLISGGEAKTIHAAALTITWAILGILFLIVAWLILLLVESFTGVKITVFCVNTQGCP